MIEFILTMAWWWIPTGITILCFLTWLVISLMSEDGDGYMPNLTPIFLLVPASSIVTITWMVAAILK